MSPEERADADQTKAAATEEATSCLSACRHLFGLTAEQLGYRGYKTEAEAIRGTVKYYAERQDKLWKAFFKRWPDQR